MPELQQFPVATLEGVRGTILRRARFLDRDERSIVRLEDGREFEVNSAEVQVRPDGTFLLNAPPPGAVEAPPEAIEPTHEHEPEYNRPGPDGSVALENPMFTEEAGVERIPVNRLVDTAPETRTEGDVTIIPIVEEVMVVEKRLLLKEEIHIRRTRNQVREPRRIVVDGPNIRILDGRGAEVRS
jgi:hypothetical protein